jgi:hypothetical protein
MRAASIALQQVEAVLQDGGAAPEDAALREARELLKRRLTDVVKRTRDQFGDPLGMLMVYLASNQDADKTVLATGDEIETLEAASAPERVAHA